VNRLTRTIGVSILVAAIGALGGIAPVMAAPPVPKVALIVGPVGGLTPTYIALANQAAKEATDAGAQVVRVYSPDASWPAVKAATDGASIVVYLGHGNGFPTRYRDTLFPPTENGFGLNPVAGVDDRAHQYFGEASVEDLHLAPNAVVVLSHLCYASGNTEPGLPQGTRDQAVQRVDNYAAGFLRAGARAVVAEGHLGPAYYVRSLLRSGLSIEQIWGRSPAAHGNTFSLASSRTAGFTERLDPDRKDGGYYRSLVSAGLDANAVRAGATGTAGATRTGPPDAPTLAGLDLAFGTVAMRSLPIADTRTVITLPLSKADVAKLPKGVMVSVRWDPILLDTPLGAQAAGDAAGSPAASQGPGAPAATAPPPTTTGKAIETPGASAAPAASPGVATPAASPGVATPDPGEDTGLPDPPAVELVVPEQQGTLVTPAKAKYSAKGLQLSVAYPADPGLYRLVATLHTSSGVAFDAATQAMLTPLLVRVGGPVAVAYGVTSSLSVPAGGATELGVRVMNTGLERWDQQLTVPRTLPAEEADPSERVTMVLPNLVATWVSASGQAVPPQAVMALAAQVATPGGETTVRLRLTGPVEPGEYLLLLDVVSPSQGSLLAHGGVPALVRVSVSQATTHAAPDAAGAMREGLGSPW